MLLLPLSSQAQNQGLATLSGQVLDSVTRAPLPFASVFLANTSRGTTTDAAGRYQLTGIALGQYELGVSYVGYRLYRQALRISGALTFNPAVAPAAQQLAEVVVRPDPNREANFQKFKELFLGSSTLARQCRLRNPDDVRVSYDPQQNVLSAIATRPLEVDNPALGYRLTFYQLDFKAEFGELSTLTLLSQVAFRELPGGSAGQQRRWAANRQKAYLGSLPHFLRSVYAGRVAEEGFEVRKLRRVVNRRRAATVERLRALDAAGGVGAGILSDSVRRILEQPPVMAYLFRPLLPPDSLRRAAPGPDGGRVWLRFHDLLAVTYGREKPDANYRLPGPNFTSLRPEKQESVLHLQLPEAEIQSFGALVVPLGSLSEDYWGFEKVGEMLPLDYEPPAVPVR
ncbi:carboxypeptidase-like regulatory domain-containing protein [uncultured Hymenobacter sp.]|uniref:carboxypeptidase-like regulatory domain-containing protein n=1 Tax=uncultured Hymenobacter sp. TaxID=170016 RepID=UPI0035CC43D9